MKNYCRLKPRPQLLKRIRHPQQQRLRFLKLLGTYNKPNTIEAYRSAIKKFQSIVKKPIQRLTPDDILRFFEKTKRVRVVGKPPKKQTHTHKKRKSTVVH
jgi:hypothetical protein